jgi:hypothetical protein
MLLNSEFNTSHSPGEQAPGARERSREVNVTTAPLAKQERAS